MFFLNKNNNAEKERELESRIAQLESKLQVYEESMVFRSKR